MSNHLGEDKISDYTRRERSVTFACFRIPRNEISDFINSQMRSYAMMIARFNREF